MLKSFKIEDDLSQQDSMAIEVVVELESGESRWCFFITPAALSAAGDRIGSTNISIHYGAPHMIVVGGRLSSQIIEQALQHIDQEGDLLACTKAFG